MRRSLLIILLLALLVGSLTANYLLYRQVSGRPYIAVFADANSRDTYYTVHRVLDAHAYGRGSGVRVGILDTRFGTADHAALYAGTEDFIGDPTSLHGVAHHGYFMALALREIAPECEIYALNVLHANEQRKVEAMVQAIDWAIASGLDILTYSAPAISDALRPALDAAVERAAAAGLITCFIHYDHTLNILPCGLFAGSSGDYDREPDIRVLHYDYNVLFLEQYRRFVETGRQADSGNDIPYFSLSSTSPVTAGFVAILKSIDRSLGRDECLQLLQETSYTMEFTGPASFERGAAVSRVADIGAAARRLADR